MSLGAIFEKAIEYDEKRNEYVFEHLWDWAEACVTLYKQGYLLKQSYCYTGLESGKKYLTAYIYSDTVMAEVYPEHSLMVTYLFPECTGKSPFYKLRDR